MVARNNKVISLELVNFIKVWGDHDSVLFVVLRELGPDIAEVTLHMNRVHRLVSLNLQGGTLSTCELHKE